VLESDRRLTIVPRLVLGTLLVHSPSSRIVLATIVTAAVLYNYYVSRVFLEQKHVICDVIIPLCPSTRK